ADHADSLGTGAVANSGVLQVGEGKLKNTLSGTGSLVKTGTGELTLSGDNDYSGGTTKPQKKKKKKKKNARKM
ncbi:AIDA autotransporter-like protein ShdA, partial [Salmonella enterica subsp. enterica serovar Newport str. SHSN003]